MPRTIVTLRSGEQKVFENVGAIMGGQNNALLTFFNEDPEPRPFFAIAASEVLTVDTPEFNRPPTPDLKLPTHLRTQ